MNTKEKTHSGSFKSFVTVLFLFLFLTGMQASAASYKRIQVGSDFGPNRIRVGSTYFWGAYLNNGYEYFLYTAGAGTGNENILARLDPDTSSDTYILTDGKTVIYPYYSNGKTTIYSIRTDGTQKKTLTTFNGGPVFPLKRYRTKCYFLVIKSGYSVMYCLDMNTGKKTRMAKGNGLRTRVCDSTRYLYSMFSKSNKVLVKVTDGRTAGETGTFSIAKKYAAWVSYFMATPQNVYVSIVNGACTQAIIYQMSADGSRGFARFRTIRPPVSDSIILGVYVVNDTYALYQIEDCVNVRYLSYKYTFSDGKSKRITNKSLEKVLESPAMSY